MKCAVVNCNNSNESKASDCSFFRFPVNAAIRKKWISFCGRPKLNPSTSFVCMPHFTAEDFGNSLQYEMGFAKRRLLKDGSVPSVNIASVGNYDLFQERSARIKKRENKKLVSRLLDQPSCSSAPSQENEEIELNETLERPIGNLNEMKTNKTTENALVSVEFQYESLEKENLGNLPDIPSKENVSPDLSPLYILKLNVEKLEKENRTLKKEVKKSDAALKIANEKMEKMQKISNYKKEQLEVQLAKIKSELACLEEKLEVIFTKGQIKKLKKGIKRQTWSENDVAHSITLYAASPKLYRLLHRKQFPLLAIRTLQRWAQKLQITKGLIKLVFKILKASHHMNETQKLSVLSFDEMNVKSSYCYDKVTDTTLAPVSYLQVAMLRGLMSKWKQPIFYCFDTPMTKEILLTMLNEVKSCGFTVVAMVSDLGGTNRSLLNELEITVEKPWFYFNNEKVFSFADVPHLIKLLRNHFLDQGFVIDGKTVQTDIVSHLLEETSDDLSITHKISNANLSVAGAKRQNVKLATKLFSHTVAQAITRAASLGHLDGKNWNECHRLFKITNDWFDIMNVRVPRDDRRTRRHGYGLSLEEQDSILDEMSSLVNNMRAVGRKSLLPFQKGILQSNNALRAMFADMKAGYGLKYILTYRLNQDVLENFFGVIRAKGGLHDHPDQQEFKYRLRLYLLGRNEGVLSNAANVEVDDTPDLEMTNKSFTGIIFTNIKVNVSEDDVPAEQKEIEGLAYDGLENLAGYICHKLKNAVPDISVLRNAEPESYTWVHHLSEGGLSRPTQAMMSHIEALDAIYKRINSNDLLITQGYLKQHLEQAESIQCNEKVKKLFFRARMYFKIRSLNREMAEASNKTKRKWNKTLN